MSSFRSRARCAAASAALVAGGVAACTGEPRYPIRAGEAAGGGIEAMQPRYPIRPQASEPTRAPPAPAPEPRNTADDAPRAAPSGEVSTSTLPPPTAPSKPIPYSEYLARNGERAPAVAPLPAIALPAERAVEAVPTSPVAVVRAVPAVEAPPLQTARNVTVAPGETLFDIAERERTPVRAVIDLNALQPPYALAPGTVLRIPPPLTYRVQGGDTLSGVARRFNIDTRSLASLNGLAFEAPLAAGQSVILPSLARDQGSNAQARGASPAGSRGYTFARVGARVGGGVGAQGGVLAGPGASSSGRGSRPYASLGRRSAGIASTPSDPGIAPQALQPTPDAPPPSAVQVASLGRGRFVWPLRGAILSGFGDKAPGQRNDGLNIAATPGDSVHASAAGEVVYAGNQIPGFGNLVLVKHAGGWVTAYAHLSHIDVRMREAVTQGEPVGEAGQTGAVERPQVHFEIRYAPTPRDKARPVDPAALLPAAG